VSTAAPLGKWGKTNPIQVRLPLGTRQEGGRLLGKDENGSYLDTSCLFLMPGWPRVHSQMPPLGTPNPLYVPHHSSGPPLPRCLHVCHLRRAFQFLCLAPSQFKSRLLWKLRL
jgi:hypothetical protein